MAERQLEIAQKALRRSDYDSLSDSDDSGRFRDSSSASTPTHMNFTPKPSSSIRQRGRMNSQSSQPSVVTVSTSFGSPTSSFDPYAPSGNDSIRTEGKPSLFDEASFDNGTIEIGNNNRGPQNSSSLIPGSAGYLEMEQEPPRPIVMADEPIKTDSGLLLTHRRSPTVKKPRPVGPHNEHVSFRTAQNDYFEVEHGGNYGDNYGGWGPSPPHGSRHSMITLQVRRLMSYVKIWVVISALFLLAATGVLFHSFGHTEEVEDNSTIPAYYQEVQIGELQNTGPQSWADMNGVEMPENIILLPIENLPDESQQTENSPPLQMAFHHVEDKKHSNGHDKKHSNGHDKKHSHDQHNVRRHLMDLRDEFESWVLHHGKNYHSSEEKERRFHIWSSNHHKTIEKNRKHGPCKMTKQQVFGSNHFKDLTPDEFKTMYLTGYKGPKADELMEARKTMTPNVRKLSKDSGRVLNPNGKIKMHDSVREKINKHRAAAGQRLLIEQKQAGVMGTSGPNCKWYDISCLLRWVWQTAGVEFGAIIGTMEPMYDADAYPNAVDWRDSGAVTSVRSQGDCGACWAITAVETIESAYYLSTNKLYDLSEAEIITCDESCEMCSGGWPQNAYEWTMDHGGLPLYKTFPYDGSSLLAMTNGIEGTSDSWTEDMVKEYRQQVCPSDNQNNARESSYDNNEYYDNGEENEHYGDYTDKGRYGNIKGYGYATDRCICYSNGEGCDCDNQNEGLAVRNLATYGPAVVCLEASLWQDYTGGIITSESGCGSAFLDMNHCVQAVGYAYTNVSDDDEEDDQDRSRSGSGSGSKDESSRQGYWIIRNQWGSYWGMQGYAYVAMGENTCGVLNDMTQVYM